MTQEGCSFVSKTGRVCNRTKLSTSSSWCHIRSHYPNNETYDRIVGEIRKGWEYRTISPDLFTRMNVPEDGWCFFYSFGLSIYKMMKKMVLEADDVIETWESSEPIIEFFRHDIFKPFFKGEIDENTFMNHVVRKLHDLASRWILEHLDDEHDQTKESILQLLLDSHEIETLEEYKEEIQNLPQIDEEKSLSRSNWGSVCEQYALSKHFHVNTLIFSPSRFSKNRDTYRTYVAKVVRKGIRYMMMSHSIGIKEESLINKFFTVMNDDSSDIETFWDIIPETLKEKLLEELSRTVFLLLFILQDTDGDDMSHYNVLFLDKGLLPKK